MSDRLFDFYFHSKDHEASTALQVNAPSGLRAVGSQISIDRS